MARMARAEDVPVSRLSQKSREVQMPPRNGVRQLLGQ
jgi:hypothetical protein